MKRILSILCTIALLLTSMSVIGVSTSAATEGYYTYEIENGQATITGVDRSISGNITVPAELGGCPVTAIGAYAFFGRSNLEQIKIPDGVTSIGNSAFSDCSNLEQIKIPDGVTEIESGTFSRCSNLRQIYLPNTLTSIGSSAFYYCSSLQQINLPDTLTLIDSSAFYGCTGLQAFAASDQNEYFSVIDGVLFDIEETTLICYPSGKGSASYIVPNSVTSIGECAFSQCSSLQQIKLPDNLTSIGSNAFSYCSKLEQIQIPDGITEIEYDTFSGCSSLQKIDLPDNLMSIGNYAFSDCSNLEQIKIPDGVTSIGDRAFFGCTGLQQIDLPDALTSIGEYAFSGCSSLGQIKIPDDVTEIKYEMFSDCSSLQQIDLPDNLTSIDSGAFSGCSSLKSFTISDTNTHFAVMDGVLFNKEKTTLIYYPSGKGSTYSVPSGVMSIDRDAFCGCKSLQQITIPDGVTEIQPKTFSYCSGLQQIKLPNTLTSIGEYAFNECCSLQQINLPDSLISIGESAFTHCDSLQQVDLPKNLTSIDSGAFFDCTGLQSFTISDTNTHFSVMDGVLFNKEKTTLICYPAGKGISSYNIPNNVTSIDSGAFASNSSLQQITIPAGITEIEMSTFSYCTSLQQIKLPDHLTSIGAGAFRGCSSLLQIGFPDSLTSIDAAALEDCSSLQAIKLPDHLTSIGEGAFSGCIGLEQVAIPDGTTEIKSGIFSGCTGLQKIAIPSSVTTIGWYTFEGCKALTDIYFGGNEAQWNTLLNAAISAVGNDSLLDAQVHYNANGLPSEKTLTAVTVSSKPTKTSYQIGEKLNTAGLKLKLTYSDGTTNIISSGFTVSGFSSKTAGKKTVKVTYAGFTTSFTVTVTAAKPAVDSTKKFTDVPKGKWYVGAVNFAVANGLFEGMDETHFAPNGSMTRAMYVTVLGRLAGAKVSNKTATKFSDVPTGQWYTGYVKWASDNGIVEGDNGKFSPNANVTREQICKMMIEYCSFAGIKLKSVNKAMTFKDADQISGWAKGYVKNAQTAGFVNGDNGYFDPKGNATRAQVATIFMNFQNNYSVL